MQGLAAVLGLALVAFSLGLGGCGGDATDESDEQSRALTQVLDAADATLAEGSARVDYRFSGDFKSSASVEVDFANQRSFGTLSTYSEGVQMNGRTYTDGPAAYLQLDALAGSRWVELPELDFGGMAGTEPSSQLRNLGTTLTDVERGAEADDGSVKFHGQYDVRALIDPDELSEIEKQVIA